ncbi:MAG TPA: ABC transporter permease [Candidatus Acidoferrales bacterium]|nr:ABC transporter permease [Candidatus Acidoferrales bacterium]
MTILRRRREDEERERELADYLARETEGNIARGMAPDEARRAAHVKLGNARRIREEIYEMNGIGFLETLWQDLRYAFRMLRKSPGFTIVAVLTLALGIGANTAIFSVVDAVLVRGLPFHEPSRLVCLFQTPGKANGIMGWAASGPDIVDWQRYSHSFTAIAAVLMDEANISGGSAPQHVNGQKVEANYFDLLGANASIGRTFARGGDESGRDNVAILSYALWQGTFGGQNILGRTIELDDEPFTVIGVMPATYRDPRTWMNPESSYWIPLRRTRLEANRGQHMYAVFGRLSPGVTLAQAQREMTAIGEREAKEFPDADKGFGVLVSPLQRVSLETFEEGSFQSVSPAIIMLQLAAVFLLVLACANVANLMFSRMVIRRPELALRAAMGAGRGRILRQLLTESVALSVLGGGAGVLLAIWFKNILVSVAPKGYLPATASVSLDPRVLGFTLGVAILCGVMFGLLPALRMSRQNLGEELKGAATGSALSSAMPRVRRALIVFELATTFLLLIGGGLMLRSLSSLMSVSPGFNPRNFFTAGVSLSAQRYAKAGQIAQFFSLAQDRVEKLPGVEAAAFTSSPEFDVTDSSDVRVEERSVAAGDPQKMWPQICFVSPDFLRAAGIPLLAGRDFVPSERSTGDSVAIVTQAFAKYFWPGKNAIGMHMSYGGGGWREIVGVVGDVHQQGLAAAPYPEVYMPLTPMMASGQNAMNIVVRSATAPATLAREIEKEVWAIDSSVPLSDVRTGDQLMTQWAGYLRYRTVLLASFAAMALLIAVIGVFGAISYTTAQRTREIGIRLALGAQRRDVMRLVLAQGAKIVLVGLLIGMGGAFALTRLMASLLYGVSAYDPLTFAGVAILLGLVALAACYVPARRAMRVDPMVALRYE